VSPSPFPQKKSKPTYAAATSPLQYIFKVISYIELHTGVGILTIIPKALDLHGMKIWSQTRPGHIIFHEYESLARISPGIQKIPYVDLRAKIFVSCRNVRKNINTICGYCTQFCIAVRMQACAAVCCSSFYVCVHTFWIPCVNAFFFYRVVYVFFIILWRIFLSKIFFHTVLHSYGSGYLSCACIRCSAPVRSVLTHTLLYNGDVYCRHTNRYIKSDGRNVSVRGGVWVY